MNSLLNKVQSAALDLAMDYVLKDPAHNITRLLDAVETLDISGEHAGQLQTVRPMAENPDNTWNKLLSGCVMKLMLMC